MGALGLHRWELNASSEGGGMEDMAKLPYAQEIPWRPLEGFLRKNYTSKHQTH